MATLSKTYKANTLLIDLTRKCNGLVEGRLPRRCMVVSVGLTLAGSSIPVLMAFHLIPVTLLLGFVGFALAATGGIMALTFCGEI